MLDFTFLTADEVFGKDRLIFFNNKHHVCRATDYAILHGIMRTGGLKNESGEYSPSGLWWLKDKYGSYKKRVLTCTNDLRRDDRDMDIAYIGVRPAISYSSISPYVTNVNRLDKGILEVDFGAYPRDVVSSDLSEKLENIYNTGTLNTTSKVYTCKSTGYTNSKEPPDYKQFVEYEYNGERYIRYVCNECLLYVNFHGCLHVIPGDVFWIKVEPIKWIVDELNDVALSKEILFSGMKYDDENYMGDFEETSIKKYIDLHFAREIIPVDVKNQEKDETVNKTQEFKKFFFLEDWIEWSNSNNIHPLIHVFMISFKGKYMNEDIDWLEISNCLYKNKDISSICDLLDPNIYNELVNLYSFNISLEDIKNNNYDIEKINNMSNSEKYLLVIKLLLINDSDYDVIYDFTNKLGSKYTKSFNLFYEQCKNFENNSVLSKVMCDEK